MTESELHAAGGELCSEHHHHADAIESLQQKLPDEDALMDLADTFRVFGDTTRVKIISALLTGPLCVCDITDALGVSQSAVSHQLRILRSHRLVKYRREGRLVYYTLDDEHISSIIRAGLDHVLERRGEHHENE
ncbi:ArsR/SmtB family transcription factor [Zongyangia hominis]|uniref:Helix-turn-helix transcriptional regulator n=1 Tax=Zongyangia hominis TaxID=2763677 RepID=A0A926EFT3_9FIRM|nr:metalloregulator ArsR/SmtB family transcription factor [Zongyangia hominis]MBC8571046.1 helix-turn-helix transcriptional regulator [Zongyangia hominis]